MIRSELVSRLCETNPDLTPEDLRAVVDTVFEAIVQALEEGRRVEIRGFGSFAVKTYPPRKGRNPKTGDPVDIPMTHRATFRAGKRLKQMINDKA